MDDVKNMAITHTILFSRIVSGNNFSFTMNKSPIRRICIVLMMPATNCANGGAGYEAGTILIGVSARLWINWAIWLYTPLVPQLWQNWMVHTFFAAFGGGTTCSSSSPLAHF